MEAILKVSDLTKMFENRKKIEFYAVDHVSFQVMPGQTVGIVGESGSGKSTLAKLLCCLEEPTEGQIRLCGQEIGKRKGKKQREMYRKLQMVFQDPVSSFDPRRTLGDGIGESLRNHGMSREEAQKRVELLLEQCGLPEEFAGRYPHEVSGGQCQRAAIARALAIEPQLLICDEATSALDTESEKLVQNALESLMKNRTTIVIAHRLSTIKKADEICVLHEGKIVERGKHDELLALSGYYKRLCDMQSF